MENKKYNLLTAIAMVVGIVVGSGVFFKAANILKQTDGNLKLSILAWVIGGLVMVVSAYNFALIAANTKSGDLIDIAEETVGRKHAYVLSWYCSVIYYPLLCGVLGWVCASFTCILFNVDSTLVTCILAFVYVITLFLFNILVPKIAGYLQVSSTVIKLVPLVFMAIVGTIYGFVSTDGTLVENFTSMPLFANSHGFMAALCGTCFAYEGWIVATSISKELKDPKKNLPRALVIGTLIILGIYITYYIGLAGTYPNDDFMLNGDSQVKLAFTKIMGKLGGTILYVFVVISCIGTLNGLVMGTSRCFKSMGETNNGPLPEKFKKLNKQGMNNLSSILGFILSLFWLGVWLFMLYKGLMTEASWAIDISELVIIFVYLAYIPIYISTIRKRDDLHPFKRYVMPVLAILAALLMIYAGIVAHGGGCITFLLITGSILFIGMLFYKDKKNVENE